MTEPVTKCKVFFRDCSDPVDKVYTRMFTEGELVRFVLPDTTSEYYPLCNLFKIVEESYD